MNSPTRRDFLLGIALMTVPVFAHRKKTPIYYSVQWDNLIGVPCTLFWDGKQDWKVECNKKTYYYTHPHPWQGLDSEFYKMQTKAQYVMNAVRESTYQERLV